MLMTSFVVTISIAAETAWNLQSWVPAQSLVPESLRYKWNIAKDTINKLAKYKVKGKTQDEEKHND